MKAHNYIRAEQRRFRRAAEGQAWSIKELPQFYYHRHFCDMLTHVSTRYTNIMGKAHTGFIRDFSALPFESQCAYARIAGRKGSVFNVHHLHYSEIKDLSGQFEYLRQTGFVRSVEKPDFGAYLERLTKPELTELMLDRVPETEFKRSWKKNRLIEIAQKHIEFEDISLSDNIIVQDRLEALHFLLYLHFGRIETSLQSKTLSELGLVRPVPKEKTYHEFTSFEEAETSYFYARALNILKIGIATEIDTLISNVENWPVPHNKRTELQRGKLLQKLGGLSERQGEIDNSLSLYTRGDNAHCNERVVRLRYARNEKDDRNWAQGRLEAMIENPESDGEYLFAQDFYQRKFKKKRTSFVTDILRDSQIISLDEAYRHTPERAAMRHFREKGFEVYRTENRPWLTLFGLLFWEELYFEDKSSMRSLPLSLRNGTFYAAHKPAIETKLKTLDTPSKALILLLKTMTKHYNEANGVFIWGGRSLDRIKALITHSPKEALAKILRQMCENYNEMKDGFPDLMLIENGGIRFIEVKAEGDVLRRNQLTRLRQSKAAGYDAEVLRIGWHIDPNQTYVVVDVETTGGRAGLHRVTEIGAVKMQGGEIIDEWSSLINPQRSIPPNITRITGINEQMVANAPIFAEVADSFAEFMGDAVFAAHNVNFDYGFISTEFQMIDRKFSHPKICTCSSMRKLYPGHKSYGLKNLCDVFEIDLKSHHRALCDAKAAAELLKLINEKRIDLQNTS